MISKSSRFVHMLFAVNKGLIFSVFVFVSGVAYSELQSRPDFKSEALALCDAFNPETWGKDFVKLSPSEKAIQLADKIRSAIKSEEMMSIFDELKQSASENAYKNYIDSVSKLIGEPHQCDSIQNYFSFSIE